MFFDLALNVFAFADLFTAHFTALSLHSLYMPFTLTFTVDSLSFFTVLSFLLPPPSHTFSLPTSMSSIRMNSLISFLPLLSFHFTSFTTLPFPISFHYPRTSPFFALSPHSFTAPFTAPPPCPFTSPFTAHIIHPSFLSPLL